MDDFQREIRRIHRIHMMQDAISALFKGGFLALIVFSLIWLGVKQ